MALRFRAKARFRRIQRQAVFRVSQAVDMSARDEDISLIIAVADFCNKIGPFRKSGRGPAKSAIGGRPDMTRAGRHFAV